jgi:hypothetical protein
MVSSASTDSNIFIFSSTDNGTLYCPKPINPMHVAITRRQLKTMGVHHRKVNTHIADVRLTLRACDASSVISFF